MAKNKQLTLGRLYEIDWMDHDSVETNTEAAVFMKPTILKGYGIYVGTSPHHHIFAYIYENSASENNENLRILKDKIVKIRELK